MRLRIFAGGVLLSTLAMTASASMITTGSFNIDGEIYVTGLVSGSAVTIPGVGTCPAGEACIFWQDNSLPPVNDKVDITAAGLPNGSIPAAIAGVDAANIGNLFDPPEVVDAGGFPPTFFMSFNNAGITTQLMINSIAAGIDPAAGCLATPPAAGQVCTPPGSLFNLQNLTSSSSTVGWSFSGVTNDDPNVRWTGTFTSQFNTMNYQQVLAALSANGFVQNSFSGSITLVVPEPGPLTAVGMGLMLILCSVGIRRSFRSR